MTYTNKFDFDPGLFKDETFHKFAGEPVKRNSTRSKMTWMTWVVLGLFVVWVLVTLAMVIGSKTLNTLSQEQKPNLNTTSQGRVFMPSLPALQENNPPSSNGASFCDGKDFCTTTTTTNPAETLQILATAIQKNDSNRYKIHLSIESID